jgi:hypothetical protein
MENLSCSLCGYFCNNYHHHNCWFDTTEPTTLMKTVEEWFDFEKAVGAILKQYPLIKPTTKDIRLAKKLWKEGRSPKYAANFILLAHR